MTHLETVCPPPRPPKNEAGTWSLRPQVSLSIMKSSYYLNTFWVRDIKLFLSFLYLREFCEEQISDYD